MNIRSNIRSSHGWEQVLIWFDKKVGTWKSPTTNERGWRPVRIFGEFECVSELTMTFLSLRQSWNTALNDAQAQLQSLLTSAASPLWRRVPPVTSESTQDGSQSASEEAQVIIHKRPSKQGEIFRLVHDIPVEDFSIAFWKAVLVTPEMRQEWDPAVESAQLLETFDVDVRIAKTYFTLGWPAK